MLQCDAMDTEHASPRYSDIDLWEPSDVLHAMLEGQMAAVAAVRAVIPALEQAVLAMETRLRAGGRLVYVGAGTSGRPRCRVEPSWFRPLVGPRSGFYC